MITAAFITTLLFVMRAVVILWFASVGMLEAKRIRPFLPLASYSIAFCGLATLHHYDLLLTVWQAVFASMVFLSDLWLLVVIVRIIKKQP